VVISTSELRDVKVLDSERESGRSSSAQLRQYRLSNSVAGKNCATPRQHREDRGKLRGRGNHRKYPVGTPVIVYYNPLHPNEAVLDRDLPKGPVGLPRDRQRRSCWRSCSRRDRLNRISEFFSASAFQSENVGSGDGR